MESEYEDIHQYLMNGTYLEGLNREEKVVFQHKVAPYTIIYGVQFRMGADDKLRRCLEKWERKEVIQALHAGDPEGTWLP